MMQMLQVRSAHEERTPVSRCRSTEDLDSLEQLLGPRKTSTVHSLEQLLGGTGNPAVEAVMPEVAAGRLQSAPRACRCLAAGWLLSGPPPTVGISAAAPAGTGQSFCNSDQ
ncbi:hypothetical protein FJT64_020150 [Amphibalanus amphitrite]|uniref:Uncharacterized protein n=1 Tax=Amphibalanus amphitrite TaxID=1232801 RepID=A0A6A4WXW6_AMPAM|nr:hypothetical protein FJT64_020150 [Amphibalanus amphitrite]